MELLAVYGTLKKDSYNHGILSRSGAEYVATTVTTNKYTMYDGGFPRVVVGDDSQIHIEVYKIDTFQPTDRLEGHPHFYRRELVPVEGFKEHVWMYICQHIEPGPIIHNGLWPSK